MWDEITCSFLSFNGAVIKCWEWTSKYMSHLAYNYLSIPGLKLIYVNERNPFYSALWNFDIQKLENLYTTFLYTINTAVVKVLEWPLQWRVYGRDGVYACCLFTQPFIQAQIKENIKVPRHWPLWGEITENVFIWWRYHDTSESSPMDQALNPQKTIKHIDLAGKSYGFCCEYLNILRPRRDGRHFTCDIFKCIFSYKNCFILSKLSLKHVRKGLIDNNPTSRRQAIIWTSDGLVWWHIYASLDDNELLEITIKCTEYVIKIQPRAIFRLLSCKAEQKLELSSLYYMSAFDTYHYIEVIMTTMASQIISLTVIYSTVYSDADQRKHQSSASLAFVCGIHRDRWILRTKGQLRGKCFYLMTLSRLLEILIVIFK